MWFRLVNQRASLTVSDLLLLVASAELLALFCILVKENAIDAIHEHVALTPKLMKLSFTTVILYDTSLYVLKFSILTMYLTIFPSGRSKQRIALYLAFACTAIFALTAPLMAIFWCGPHVEKHWALESGCTFWNRKLFIIDWIMNMLSDIMILLLPFPLLAKLSLSRRQIVALCVTFGLGTVTIVVSTLRFSTFIRHAFLPLYIWSCAEISTGIMVVSLPALRPLLRKAGSAVNPNSTRRHSSWPNQTFPRSPRGTPSIAHSRVDHRSNQKLSEGYHYDYDEERADSDIELHGTLKSDSNQSGTKLSHTETNDFSGHDRFHDDFRFQNKGEDIHRHIQKARRPL